MLAALKQELTEDQACSRGMLRCVSVCHIANQHAASYDSLCWRLEIFSRRGISSGSSEFTAFCISSRISVYSDDWPLSAKSDASMRRCRRALLRRMHSAFNKATRFRRAFLSGIPADVNSATSTLTRLGSTCETSVRIDGEFELRGLRSNPPRGTRKEPSLAPWGPVCGDSP